MTEKTLAAQGTISNSNLHTITILCSVYDTNPLTLPDDVVLTWARVCLIGYSPYVSSRISGNSGACTSKGPGGSIVVINAGNDEYE